MKGNGQEDIKEIKEKKRRSQNVIIKRKVRNHNTDYIHDDDGETHSNTEEK